MHQAGLALLVCQSEQMPSLRPAAWVVAPPVHLPPDQSLLALHLTAPTLLITPWLADTRRLVSIYQPVKPVMVVYPDHARRHVRRYLTLLAHTNSGVLTVPAARSSGGRRGRA